MYCIKCGKQIEDGRTVCEACEAAQTLPYNPEADPLNQPQPAPEQPFVLNNPVEEAPKPVKKKKGFPVGGIVAAVLVVAIAVTAVFCWDAISSFFVRSFGTPEDYLMHVEEKAAEENINSFTSSYGQMLNALGGGEMEHTGVSGEMHLTIGEDLLEMLEMGMASSGMDMDFGWLSDIKMSVSSSIDGDLTESAVGIGLGKTTIATINMILDMENGDCYLTVPELTDTYVELNMEDAGLDMSQMDQSQEAMNELVEMLPSEQKLNEVLIKYWDIVLANVEDVEKSTETVEVDGLEQKLNVITFTVTDENLLDIAIAILEDVQGDEELLECVINIVGYAAANTVIDYEEVWNDEWGYYEYVPVYGTDEDAEEIVTEGIDSALETLEEAKDELEGDVSIEVTTYIDNSDKIVGRTFEIETPDETVEVYYITVWEKNEFAFEANIADMVEIEGSGNREKKLLSGEYEISVEGEHMLTLEVADYDEKAAEEGYINGTFTLMPSDDVLEMITDEMGSSEIGDYLDFANLALEIKMANTATSNDIAVTIQMGGADLIGFSIFAEYVEGGTVKAPSKTVDMYDEEALMEWVMDMDFEKVLENLGDAGLPGDLLDMLESALGQMDSFDEPSIEAAPALPDDYYN